MPRAQRAPKFEKCAPREITSSARFDAQCARQKFGARHGPIGERYVCFKIRIEGGWNEYVGLFLDSSMAHLKNLKLIAVGAF